MQPTKPLSLFVCCRPKWQAFVVLCLAGVHPVHSSSWWESSKIQTRAVLCCTVVGTVTQGLVGLKDLPVSPTVPLHCCSLSSQSAYSSIAASSLRYYLFVTHHVISYSTFLRAGAASTRFLPVSSFSPLFYCSSSAISTEYFIIVEKKEETLIA